VYAKGKGMPDIGVPANAAGYPPTDVNTDMALFWYVGLN
jgi:hypothetical protein